MEDILIAVDLNDRPQRPVPKTEAHEKCVLHRAFSVILTDEQGRILMQKRALSKYHCGGLWSNTCCSHPLWGEDLESAVARKLVQELGIRSVQIREIGRMNYCCRLDNGMSEYEYDHIFTGRYEGEVTPNPEEVECAEWMGMEEILESAAKEPERFTPWFIQMIPYVREAAEERKDIELERLPYNLSVCKLEDASDQAAFDAFRFLAKTGEENSLVCRTEDAPRNALAREDGWKGFRVRGVLDFSLTGILAGITGALAEKGIPVFAVSTYDTDYILVRKEDSGAAAKALEEAGYVVS